MIYLDYNATSPLKPAVRAAVMEAMERHGNPSSVHRYGRIARRYVEEARTAVAALAGVTSSQIIFTSGGTEANNMVLRDSSFPHIFTSSIEHDSILAVAPDATRLLVDQNGVINLKDTEEKLRCAPEGSLVSVMLVNNETGNIQPVVEIARLAKFYGHKVHTDAVQAAGRLPIDFEAMGVDYLTLSAHKIGGPQGVGALVVAEKVKVAPLIKGGGQEMWRRAGTENVPGIVGFGVSSRLAIDDLREMPRVGMWRDNLEAQILAIGGADAIAIGRDQPRVANTLSLAMRGVSSETQVVAMDLSGIAVSAGSACTSGKVKTSHVLLAMGYSREIASSALRISLGWNTKAEDIVQCVDAWRILYNRTFNKKQQSKAA